MGKEQNVMPEETATAAATTQTTTSTTTTTSIDTVPGGQDGRLEPFSILYAAPGSPEQVHVEVLQAPSETAARRAAEYLFPGYDVLSVCPAVMPRDDTAYPRARFIKGRFHAADAVELHD